MKRDIRDNDEQLLGTEIKGDTGAKENEVSKEMQERRWTNEDG